jgi:hypothetical protein
MEKFEKQKFEMRTSVAAKHSAVQAAHSSHGQCRTHATQAEYNTRIQHKNATKKKHPPRDTSHPAPTAKALPIVRDSYSLLTAYLGMLRIRIANDWECRQGNSAANMPNSARTQNKAARNP